MQAFNLIRSGAGEIPQCPSHSIKAEKMARIVQELLQGEKQLLEKVVAHADFLRLYWSPARRSLNPSVVVRLKEGDDLGFAGCCTRIM